MIDRKDAGRRVELVSTSDPYTRLRPGSKGTLKFETDDAWSIDWDDGSKLSMVKGEDSIKFID
jgi:hypothetical protein